MERIEDVIYLIDAEEKEKTKSFLFRYIKQWPWFLATSILGIVLGYFIFKNTPTTYQVSSTILVGNTSTDMNSVLAFSNSKADGTNNVNKENKIQILRSFTLYRNTLENLGWDHAWYLKRIMYNEDLYKNQPFELLDSSGNNNAKHVPIEIELINENEVNIHVEGDTYMNGYKQKIDITETVKLGQPFKNEFFNFTIKKGSASLDETYILEFNSIDAMTSNYLARTNISSDEEKSDIVTISLQGQNRQREADFINELTKVLIESGMENRFESSENTVEFIDSQLESLKNSLGTAEENISNYRKNNQAQDLGQEAQTIYNQLEEIEKDQYLTNLQLDFYNNLQTYIDDANKMEQVVNPSVIGITDENLTSMLTSLRELYRKREVLSYSVKEKNPAYIVLEKEIEVARNALEQTLVNQKKTTEIKMESLNKRRADIQKRLARLPDTEKRLIGVERDFNLNNEFYTYMLQKKTEASISKASIAPEVQIIDKAIVAAATRTGPNLMINVAAGMIAGGIIPFIFITLIGFFNNKIDTLYEVERGIKIPVFEGIMKHKYKAKIPVVQHPRSGIAESFRGLKTNINTILEKPDSKVIAVNSLIPGEGKSFISSNLSAVLSKTNKKILLIGADLHKPTLHEFLGVKESFGLSNYLNNEKSLEDIIESTPIPNLFFIQTGKIPDSPSDLLDSSKFEKLIEQTRKMFDYIVIDNAPLLLIPDAILTSQFCDIVLFILRMNYSQKAQIKQINKIVEFNKIETAAVVLNDMPESGYAYGYGYRKKYWKNGYGEFKS
jgi:capsular exopolysaccharide synthesis family protein